MSDSITNELVPTTTISTDNDLSITSVEDKNKIQSHEIQSGLNPFDLLNQLKPDAQFEEITDEIISDQHELKFAYYY